MPVFIVTLASGQAPSALAINDTSVFWWDNVTASLVSVSKDGGAVGILASDISVGSVVADNANVTGQPRFPDRTALRAAGS